MPKLPANTQRSVAARQRMLAPLADASVWQQVLAATIGVDVVANAETQTSLRDDT